MNETDQHALYIEMSKTIKHITHRVREQEKRIGQLERTVFELTNSS